MTAYIKRKTAILTVAGTILAAASSEILAGAYLEGALLLVAGLILVGLYEIYQIEQIPATAGQIEQGTDSFAEVLRKRYKQR